MANVAAAAAAAVWKKTYWAMASAQEIRWPTLYFAFGHGGDPAESFDNFWVNVGDGRVRTRAAGHQDNNQQHRVTHHHLQLPATAYISPPKKIHQEKLTLDRDRLQKVNECTKDRVFFLF